MRWGEAEAGWAMRGDVEVGGGVGGWRGRLGVSGNGHGW